MSEKLKKKKEEEKVHKKHQISLPAGTLQPRALEKMSKKTNMERMLKTMEVSMSPEALKTKLLTFTVNSLKQPRASFQIKKKKKQTKNAMNLPVGVILYI